MSIRQNGELLSKVGTIACVDASYVLYHTVYGAVNKWKSESPNSDVLDGFDPYCDEQKDITVFADFIDALDSKIIDALFRISNMVNEFVSSNVSALVGKILFVFDPPRNAKLKSWRYLIYKEYKGQRRSDRRKKPFNVSKAFFKAMDMLLENPKYRNRFNIDFVYSDGCEADDIIATYFTDDKNSTFRKFLVASDNDYLQIDGVVQMTLEGNTVEIKQPYPDRIRLTPSTYLLAKIITGDSSDNISQVFNRVGYRTAVKKYVTDVQYLTESLKNDAVAKARFERNMKLIDFKRMPSSIRDLSRKALGLC